jgi:hypothetical protein
MVFRVDDSACKSGALGGGAIAGISVAAIVVVGAVAAGAFVYANYNRRARSMANKAHLRDLSDRLGSEGSKATEMQQVDSASRQQTWTAGQTWHRATSDDMTTRNTK